MPKRRTRSGSSKNTTNPSPAPLLDGPLTENQNSNNDRQHSFPAIDASQLTAIVTNLITGQGDQSAYEDFLRLLEYFCVRSARDDRLEETVYHLIQAAVTFIRANEQRFDHQKLNECYRLRHQPRTDSLDLDTRRPAQS